MEINRSKQMGFESLALMNKKTLHEITGEEYYSSLVELHRKYPNVGSFSFWDAAQEYAKKNLKKREA